MRKWCGGDESYFQSSWEELMIFMDPVNSTTRDAGWDGEGASCEQARSMPMCSYWRDFSYGTKLSNLAKIGEEMGSLTVSAGSPERLWSRSGWICDRRRSKLTIERCRKLIILNADLKTANTVAVQFHKWSDEYASSDSGDDTNEDTSTDEDCDDTIEGGALSDGRPLFIETNNSSS